MSLCFRSLAIISTAPVFGELVMSFIEFLHSRPRDEFKSLPVMANSRPWRCCSAVRAAPELLIWCASGDGSATDRRDDDNNHYLTLANSSTRCGSVFDRARLLAAVPRNEQIARSALSSFAPRCARASVRSECSHKYLAPDN